MSDASETQAAQALPEQTVDQITKEPASPPERSKDPKKVRAGKALAQKNKEAREAQAALSAKKEEKEEKGFSGLFSSIQMAASVVGAGFVLWHGWQAASPLLKDALEAKKKKEGSRHASSQGVESEEEEEKTKPAPPTHTQSQTPKQKGSSLLMDSNFFEI